jgi:hypothetical protein
MTIITIILFIFVILYFEFRLFFVLSQLEKRYEAIKTLESDNLITKGIKLRYNKILEALNKSRS